MLANASICEGVASCWNVNTLRAKCLYAKGFSTPLKRFSRLIFVAKVEESGRSVTIVHCNGPHYLCGSPTSHTPTCRQHIFFCFAFIYRHGHIGNAASYCVEGGSTFRLGMSNDINIVSIRRSYIWNLKIVPLWCTSAFPRASSMMKSHDKGSICLKPYSVSKLSSSQIL